MTHEDATLPGKKVDGPPESDAPACFDAAIRAVGGLAMALSSAISEVHFAEALRLRGELGEALSRAANLAALPDPADREVAVQQLVAIRGVVRRLFQNAPAPSAVAIAAVIAGDRTALDREAQAWIVDRQASGTNPRRRARRDTQPASPKAWGATRDADAEVDAADESTRATLIEPSAADEDSAR